MDRGFIRHGFYLIFLALVGGLFVPNMEIPRLGLSAHTIGLLSGVLLIGIGSVWNQFLLSSRQRSLMYWSWLYSSYINWFGCLIGAIFGAGKMTPVASAGAVGSDAIELLVSTLLMSVALASFIAVGVSIWGLRYRTTSAS